MATITLENMQFYAHHGCFEEERKVGTNFSVTVTFSYDATIAATTDSISDAVNYAEVYQVIKKQMSMPSHLVENVAHRIKEALLKAFPAISSATVTVYKINPPLGEPFERVGVTL
ncbi:MAG: dihydroneopterin aldolase [Paludibacteraceae bacterium]|nr:dihydroneopterin aldolase [Paludibacteraceae bacterium]MBO7368647.1 dihydroneopterin aldolase [Paludibacteraceae bacterium]MBR4482805.1 dihydroneopterin aldolase [Paludibacteraceae bacterium]